MRAEAIFILYLRYIMLFVELVMGCCRWVLHLFHRHAHLYLLLVILCSCGRGLRHDRHFWAVFKQDTSRQEHSGFFSVLHRQVLGTSIHYWRKEAQRNDIKSQGLLILLSTSPTNGSICFLDCLSKHKNSQLFGSLAQMLNIKMESRNLYSVAWKCFFFQKSLFFNDPVIRS